MYILHRPLEPCPGQRGRRVQEAQVSRVLLEAPLVRPKFV